MEKEGSCGISGKRRWDKHKLKNTRAQPISGGENLAK